MSADPRRLVARSPHDPGAVALKAPRLPLHRKPSGVEVERERAMWGPHPNPAQDAIERFFYGVGRDFLTRFLGAVLGQEKVVLKADAPKPPGWGDVMALFKSPAPPEQKLSSWKSLVDTFADALLPPTTIENVAASWALRSSLLSTIGKRVNALTKPGAWDEYFRVLPPAHREMVEWSRLRGAEFVSGLSAKARQTVLDALVESQMGGGDAHALSRVLFERLGRLNHDWRRIALTETGMAVENGRLVAALAQGGEWEAVWVAGPGACPFCARQRGKVYRLVAADAPAKDGATQIWPGKNNVGRSASPFRADGTKRGPDELWQPCIPAHPHCACTWTVRRVLTGASAKRAEAMLAKLRSARA